MIIRKKDNKIIFEFKRESGTGRTKLTQKNILLLKNLMKSKEYRAVDLAKRFNINRSSIYRLYKKAILEGDKEWTTEGSRLPAKTKRN
jgi:hypothetical protein